MKKLKVMIDGPDKSGRHVVAELLYDALRGCREARSGPGAACVEFGKIEHEDGTPHALGPPYYSSDDHANAPISIHRYAYEVFSGLGGVLIDIQTRTRDIDDQRRLATVLASLRFMQRFVQRNNAIPSDLSGHFDKTVEPLDPSEIDALCERLNAGELIVGEPQ